MLVVLGAAAFLAWHAAPARMIALYDVVRDSVACHLIAEMLLRHPSFVLGVVVAWLM